MLPAYGLYTHIRANRIRSVLLLAAFAALLLAVLYSLSLLAAAFSGGGTAAAVFARARGFFLQSWPWALAGALGWFVIAWFYNQNMIDYATGSQDIARGGAPKLYAALENLCISRGITMPALKIIESGGLNAFASGMREGQYSVSVTRGLIDALTPDELEAVLGHELTHIRNKDVQLMVIATIFAGIIAFAADLALRNWDFPFGWSPRRPGRDDERRSEGNSGAIIAIAVAVGVLALSWGLSVVIRLAISRQREFLADAGSVELTKNPDAMISALRKIEAHAAIAEMPSRMSAFFIESPDAREENDWLSTHPSMTARIGALVRYAGGRDSGPLAVEAPAADEARGAPAAAKKGPWG